MNEQDPRERLAKHRAVAAWLEYQLGQERQTIAKLEREVAEQERRREVAYRESRFTIEQARTEEEPVRLHRGGCRLNPGAVDFYTGEELVGVLEGVQVEACETCNPFPGLRGTPGAHIGAGPGGSGWIVERVVGKGQAPAMVHVAGCRMAAGKVRAKEVGRQGAVEALRAGAGACPACRPDTKLGVLD